MTTVEPPERVRADITEHPSGLISVVFYRTGGGGVPVGSRLFRAFGKNAIEDRENRIAMAKAYAMERLHVMADGLYVHSITIEVAPS